VFPTGAIGFFGSLFEAVATAIGSGVVVGSFVGASMGIRYGLSRKQVEGRALRDGYFGAVAAICCLPIDLCIVYAA
jgi:hypothetical protein